MASNRKIAAVTIGVDDAQLAKLRAELAGIKNGVPRAIMGAINKTLPQGRTVVVKGLGDLLTVKQKNIRDRTSVARATQSKLSGSINVLGRRIGLINFKVKDTGKGKGRKRRGQGVIAQAYKTGQPERFPKAFIAKGKSNNKHVFQRAKSQGGKVAGRLPLFSRKGLSLLDVYDQTPGLQQKVIKKLFSIFGEQLLSQTDRLLNRKKADR